jgi:AAA domain (dynein-related subfamily)/CbbQ/NirQ/NorQ C-terminal
MSLTRKQIEFVEIAEEVYGICATISRLQIDELCEEHKLSVPYWLINSSSYRSDVSSNHYVLPNIGTVNKKVHKVAMSEIIEDVKFKQTVVADGKDLAIPVVHPDYVPFGFYNDLHNIIGSGEFYPIFITGLSGNGKTLMVEQVCAKLKRECIRVNISIETDESDLIGGPTLVDGNVVNRDGPVLQAMKRGSILLIDEVDRGSNKLMCMQGIMEGKPYFNKKSGEVVYPAEGFNVIATANTKGKGSEEGRYLSQVLDDAFLERFPITVEQVYPDEKTERMILKSLVDDASFVDNLVKWASIVRKSFEEGAIGEIISTRRLVHIAKAYKIFDNRLKAIQMCVARFDTETKDAFLDLYTKVDVDSNPPVEKPTKKSLNPDYSKEIPF